MKIAILSDIHGNNEALVAVLRECEKKGIKKLFILGDVVGYYDQVSEVLKQLRQYDVTFVKGNHEEMYQKAYEDDVYRKQLENNYGKAYSNTIHSLDDSELQSILDWPFEVTINIDEKKIRFIHSKYDDWQYFYPDTTNEQFEEVVGQEDVLFLGHSHYEFIRQIEDKLIVNVGSVGQNKTCGGSASWAIYDSEYHSVILMRTLYNRDNFVQYIRNSSLSKKQWLIDFLYRKKD